jgi:hypothetical protein
MIEPNQRLSFIQGNDGAVAALAKEFNFAVQPA